MRLREVSQTKFALAGDVDIHIITDLPNSEIETLFNNIWLKVFTFERSFSRFLPMSELSIFNRKAGLKNYITPGFKSILEVAKELSLTTNGLYNPFILPALQRSGYLKSAATGYENNSQEDYSDRSVVSSNRLIIGSDWATIPYGTAIDLGGCGKGYLADELCKIIESVSPTGYWISLSGDIRTMGVDENNLPIYLNIQNALSPADYSDWMIECPKLSLGVATSGTFRRQSQKDSNNWHHIIDPITQKPAKTDIRLVTVCAKNTVTADVLATCAVILGSKKAPIFLKKHGVKAALLQIIDDQGQLTNEVFGKLLQKVDQSRGLIHV